jgi:hypothetical protein
MYKRQRVDRYCALLNLALRASALLLLAAVTFEHSAYGQSGSNPAPPATSKQIELRKIPTDAAPYIVERRRKIDNATFDSRLRFEATLGQPREGCATWRIESWVRPDGRLIFQLNDPADKKVVMDGQFDQRYLEFTLGDPECNYKIRIERNK